jgi:hypothetical protein
VAAHVGVGYCDAHAMRAGRHGSSCGLLFITTPLYVGKQYCIPNLLGSSLMTSNNGDGA